MRIFVINLDRRPDRLEAMRRALDWFGLEFERISAVDGSKLGSISDQCFWYARVYSGLADQPAGAVGCFLSHRHIWQEMVDRNLPQVLVLEDDCNFADFDKTILDIDLRAHSIDLLRLEANPNRYDVFVNQVTNAPLASTTKRIADRSLSRDQTVGAGGYMLTIDAARKMLKCRKFWFPVDHWDIWWRCYKVDSALLMPVMITPNKSRSDIREFVRGPSRVLKSASRSMKNLLRRVLGARSGGEENKHDRP